MIMLDEGHVFYPAKRNGVRRFEFTIAEIRTACTQNIYTVVRSVKMFAVLRYMTRS